MKHQLPDLYREFFPEELLEADLREKSADCDDCSMTVEKRGARARITYQANLKCCTFEQFVPNYLAGAILFHADRFPKGAEVLRRKIREGKTALPLGLTADPDFQFEFSQRKAGDFGQKSEWLCPYFNREQNNCGIWKYRGSVCTTFYCRSDFGLSGMRFWGRVSDYLHFVEMALSEEVLADFAFSPRQVSECLELMMPVTEKPRRRALVRKALWNSFENEIEEFYVRCYQRVKEFDRTRFAEALGDLGKKRQRLMLAQLHRLPVRPKRMS